MKTKDLIEDIKKVGGGITEEQLRELARDFDNIPEYFRGKILEYLATPKEKREEEPLYYLVLPQFFEGDSRYLNFDLINKFYFFADKDESEVEIRTKFTHKEIMFDMPKEISRAIQYGILRMAKAN